jgi:hypothetical protein
MFILYYIKYRRLAVVFHAHLSLILPEYWKFCEVNDVHVTGEILATGTSVSLWCGELLHRRTRFITYTVLLCVGYLVLSCH